MKDIHKLFLTQQLELRFPKSKGKIKFLTSASAPAQVETYRPGQAASSTAIPMPIQQERRRPTGTKNNKTKPF